MSESTSPTELHLMTVAELGGVLGKREASSREVTEAFIDQARRVDGRVQAFVTPTFEAALEQADAADARLGNGEKGPLLGVPLALKDNLCTKGVRTTCASRILDLSLIHI